MATLRFDKEGKVWNVVDGDKEDTDVQLPNNLIQKLDKVKADLKNDNMLLSDIAITKVSKGEKIEVLDSYKATQEPVFSVKFKKK